MIVPKHYKNLSVLHEGTMPDRAYYIPAGSHLEGLDENREASDRITMLNGKWKFRCYDSIYDLQEAFYLPDFDVDGEDAGFEEIPVPGVWQNYGYDCHQYTNFKYPFREEGMLLGFDEIALAGGSDETGPSTGCRKESAPAGLYANQSVGTLAEEAAAPASCPNTASTTSTLPTT